MFRVAEIERAGHANFAEYLDGREIALVKTEPSQLFLDGHSESIFAGFLDPFVIFSRVPRLCSGQPVAFYRKGIF